MDGAEFVVDFRSQFKDLFADSLVANNLVDLLFREGIIIVGHPLFDSKLILFFLINFWFFLEVSDHVEYPGESFRLDLRVDFAFKKFDSLMIIQLLWVNLLQ